MTLSARADPEVPCFARRSDCWNRRRSRPPPSIRSAGLGRGLRGSLFEFDYVWELFGPPAKRRYGWYVLPILFRDRFVGRIEPRIDRAGGRVEVIGLWWRTASTRGEPRASSTRCAPRCVPTSTSRAQL